MSRTPVKADTQKGTPVKANTHKVTQVKAEVTPAKVASTRATRANKKVLAKQVSGPTTTTKTSGKAKTDLKRAVEETSNSPGLELGNGDLRGISSSIRILNASTRANRSAAFILRRRSRRERGAEEDIAAE